MSASPRPAGLSTTEELLADVRAGKMVVLVDDEQRENECDLILPAATITAEMVAFTIRYTGGVICLAMPNELANHLELPPMVEHNHAPRQTAYTVSIEARTGVGSGISAADRATTIKTTVKPGVTANDLVRPSSAARALNNGVPNIERTDRLVQLIGQQLGMHHPVVDQTVAQVDERLAANRAKAA